MIPDSFIIAQDCTLSQIKKAIRQWINMNENPQLENLYIELYQYGPEKYVIIPKENIDNQSFNYLVNYLYYPENINYKPKISGYTIIKDGTVFTNEKINYEIEIFVPEDDTEHDNVYAVTQYGEVFKIDFGGKTKKSSLIKHYEKPTIDFTILSAPQILRKKRLDPKKAALKERESIKRPTSIIISVIFILILISNVFFSDSDDFTSINGFIFLGIWGWFLGDYKLLQHLTSYITALSVAVVIIIYSYFMSHKLLPSDYHFLKSTAYLPLILLLIQFPLRRLFILILNREPIVDRDSTSVADLIYTSILITTIFVHMLA